jgi:aminoglycoside phosphotransferase (APT) family kinase protein
VERRLLADIAGHVRDVVRAGAPGLQVHSVVLIGEGTDNLAYEVNGELVVRFSKEPDPTRRANLISSEAELLTAVARISPLPVPQPLFADPRQGCWVYSKIPGVPLLDLPMPQRLVHTPVVAAVLGQFLAALHATPIQQMAQLVGADETPLQEWRDEAAGNYAIVLRQIPAARRSAVEAFLGTAPPDPGGPLVFSHNDLGIEHVLIDSSTGAITGVIDWSDAALTDPAYDFGLLHRDLGSTALDLALNTYQADDTTALRQRAVFYARCTLFEDLAYGIESGLSAYTDKSLTALEWLFPA